ncbi:MAG: protein kinase, partial [Myxococcales bacterium]|nr:protein kinase [Myxococcales bacterium]
MAVYDNPTGNRTLPPEDSAESSSDSSADSSGEHSADSAAISLADSLAPVGEREVIESELVSGFTANGVTSATASIFMAEADTLASDIGSQNGAISQETTGLDIRTDPDDRSGEIIGQRYRLLRQLGRGGMGTVYLAGHVSLPKTFAVKLLHKRYHERKDIAARFLQEAQAVSRVVHSNVIGVVDFGDTEDGAPFLVMEHLRGEPLDVLCKQAPLPWPRIRRLML